VHGGLRARWCQVMVGGTSYQMGGAAMTRRTSFALLLCSAALMAASCAPAGPRADGGGPAGGGTTAGQAATGPKTIHLAVDASSEPAGGMILVGRGGAVGLENFLMFHSSLTVYDQDSNLMPRLAERVPTLETGDMTVLPDGRMEVTWRLRQDAKWHDGNPMTADDFVFGNTIRSDRALGIASGPPPKLS